MNETNLARLLLEKTGIAEEWILGTIWTDLEIERSELLTVNGKDGNLPPRIANILQAGNTEVHLD